MAFSAIASIAEAVGIATTAAEVASVVAVVGEVGAVMGVVGAVTGNQDLLKVGSTLGLISGVSTLAYDTIGAGAAAGTEAAAGGATGAATDSTAAVGNAPVPPQPTQTVPLDDYGKPLDLTAGPTTSAPVTGAPAAPVQPVSPVSAPAIQPNTPLENAKLMEANGVTGVDAAQANVDAAGTRADTLAPAGPAGPQVPGSPATGSQTPGIQTPGVQKSGSFFDWLTSPGNDRTKAQIIGALASIPGGMQQAQIAQQNLALQQQRVAQTSHGSEVPRFGVLNSAMR